MANSNVPLPMIHLFPPTGKCQRNQMLHIFLNLLYPPNVKHVGESNGKMASFSQQSPQQLKTSFIETLTDAQMEVELATRGQSDNPDWFAHKQNKITASICKDVFSHMNNSNSKMPTNLIKRITTKGPIYRQVSYSQAKLFNYKTKGMIYGIENEPVAASLYKSHLHHYRMSRKSQFRRLALFWTKMIQFLLQALTELQPLSTIMAMLSSEMLR